MARGWIVLQARSYQIEVIAQVAGNNECGSGLSGSSGGGGDDGGGDSGTIKQHQPATHSQPRTNYPDNNTLRSAPKVVA